MKKLFAQLLILFSVASIDAAVDCSPELIKAVDAIRNTQNGKLIFEIVESQGPLHIRYVYWTEHPFAALWNSDRRTIYINQAHSGNPIGSILFELHNARTSMELEYYYDLAKCGILSKDEFVFAIEQMEHRNALETAALLKEGVESGIFPSDANWPVVVDFDSHYKIQQLFGHSQWLAERYDETCPTGRDQKYFGTINPSLYSESDRHDLAFYLGVRDHVIHNTEFKTESLKKLEREYVLSGAQSSRAERKAELLEAIFADDYKKNPLIFASARTNNLFRG